MARRRVTVCLLLGCALAPSAAAQWLEPRSYSVSHQSLKVAVSTGALTTVGADFRRSDCRLSVPMGGRRVAPFSVFPELQADKVVIRTLSGN